MTGTWTGTDQAAGVGKSMGTGVAAWGAVVRVPQALKLLTLRIIMDSSFPHATF